MIRHWRLANFKSIKANMDGLALGNLTIFAGANSSGKSTVIQSILLLMQTLANRERARLQLNGELVTLGQPDDLWHNGSLPDGDESKFLQIELILSDIYDDKQLLYFLLEFEPINLTQVHLARAMYAVSSDDDESYPEEFKVIYDKDQGYIVHSMSEMLFDNIIHELSRRGLSDITPLENAQVDIGDIYPRGLLVEARTITSDLNWEAALVDPYIIETAAGLKQSIPREFKEVLLNAVKALDLSDEQSSRLRSLRTFGSYKQWYESLQTGQTRKLQEYLVAHLPGLVVDVRQWHNLAFFELLEQNLIEAFTHRIRYLSANRIAPTMLFTPGIVSSWSEVGVAGANVAAAIREHSNRQIRFWDPNLHQVREAALMEALFLWLNFFQLVERVEAEDRGKLGTVLKVYARGLAKELDLTSVGFGTSQILPIILQGLLTPPRCLFIVEQPEVHLHPHVQSQMAYFFFALTRVDVQCIIETHSEYIVNQLRLLIKSNPELKRQVRIYFAERHIESGTRFEEVYLDEKGKITNWPKGFMDESPKLAQEMLLVAAESI